MEHACPALTPMSDRPANSNDLTDMGGQTPVRELPFSSLDLAEARALRARAALIGKTDLGRILTELADGTHP